VTSLVAGSVAVLPAALALLPLAGTLLAYEAGVRLQRRLGGNALANPVLVAVLLVAAALKVTGVPVAEYADGVRPLALLLGPATVALALPLCRSWGRIRQALLPVLAGVGAGVVTASVTAVTIAAALGGPGLLLRSIATKSVTAAISMAVAQEIGGDPALAAGLTVLTGISGAVICTWVLDWAGVRDPRARGLATGVTAHGIGTARMLALDAEAGAFSGLAMGLAGFAAGVLVPLAAAWLRGAGG
jgi:putative effector of murein hydrolase